MKPGFNPGPEEPPLRFEIALGSDPAGRQADEEEFCPNCAVLDPRRRHGKVMEVQFQSGN